MVLALQIPKLMSFLPCGFIIMLSYLLTKYTNIAIFTLATEIVVIDFREFYMNVIQLLLGSFASFQIKRPLSRVG